MPSWQPLIDRGERAAVAALVGDLVAFMESSAARGSGAQAERALVRAYLAEDGVVPDPADASGEALAEAVTLFAGAGAGVALFGGAAGIGWTVAHLAPGAGAVCARIDAALLAALAGPRQGLYDLIAGLVGVGVYALERGAAAEPLALRVLDLLADLARPRAAGLAWHTPAGQLPDWQRELAPQGYWNLGMAHGMPGVIALLARYVSRGIATGRARTLLEGAVHHLLAAEPPAADGRYPTWQPVSGAPRGRLAWCYGDLGVSVALLAASRACGDHCWQEQALALARACARRPVGESSVTDASLCHGAFGAVHLFNRLHAATGDALFAAAARRWLDEGLRRLSLPLADLSLLGGAAGIALVLHALVSDVEPRWDRQLLVDLGDWS